MSDHREEPAEPMHARLDRCLSVHRDSGRFAWPWIDARGRLMIGCDCPPEFHWWTRGGIAVSAALDAACATPEDRERYAHVFWLPADTEPLPKQPREMGECSREMDRILYGGAHLEGWTAPDHGNEAGMNHPAGREKAGKTARGQGMNAETSGAEKASAGRPKRTAKERREAAGEVDMLAGVATT